jgi:hypothetical protein
MHNQQLKKRLLKNITITSQWKIQTRILIRKLVQSHLMFLLIIKMLKIFKKVQIYKKEKI